MSRTYAISRNVPTTTINGCNTVLSSHSSTLTCDGGWWMYYVGMKKVAAAQGALNRIWTFLSTSIFFFNFDMFIWSFHLYKT